MKVCHFTYSFFPKIGGMEEVIHNLSLATLSHGFTPYVLAPYVRGEDNTVSVPYPVLRYSRPSSRRFGLRQLLIPLLWNYSKYHFDVIHCHSVYPTGYIARMFHKITGVPFVITPHGGDIAKNLRGHIINQMVTSRIKKTFASAQAVTAISSAIRQQILALGAISDNVYLIPNGIYLKEFHPIPSSAKAFREAHSYIVFIGRLIKRKGVDVLIQAFSSLKKICPSVTLKIAGDGEEMHALRELAKTFDLTQEINFLGTVLGAEKAHLLSGALLLVCPSLEEPFGIVNLEALASGIPIVASRTGGIPDIIKDGTNGFLVEPGNPDQLAERMRMLVEDHVLRQRMSQEALASALRFDWSNIFQDYLEIYQKLINEGQP